MASPTSVTLKRSTRLAALLPALRRRQFVRSDALKNTHKPS
jgi:hypothetical protein